MHGRQALLTLRSREADDDEGPPRSVLIIELRANRREVSEIPMTEGQAQPGKNFLDPRMRGFRTRHTVGEVLHWIDSQASCGESVIVPIRLAAGRILAEAIHADEPVPPFDRAAMDGYAVRGVDTLQAASSHPVPFRVIGEAWPGRAFCGRVALGEAVRIMTGAPLPDGADCVVKVENTRSEGSALSVHEPTSPGRHVGKRGEDITAGTKVFGLGRRLRPQDLGVLSALGRCQVSVFARPAVTVIITGDELLAAGSPARGYQIADMNSVMLEPLITRDGGTATVVGPIPDDRDVLRETLLAAARTSSLIVVSGGTSTGLEDHAPGLVAELGELAIHGVALRPAGPAALGRIGRALVVLLPGNPVSCLCASDFFAGRIVRILGGRSVEWPYAAVALPLARPLVSVSGRVDYARVRIVDGRVEPLAVSGASILSSTTDADGFVVVPHDSDGAPAGSTVTVWRYDP